MTTDSTFTYKLRSAESHGSAVFDSVWQNVDGSPSMHFDAA